MKMLFLSSGYRGVYPSIEQSILNAFQSHEISICQNKCILELDAHRLIQLCKKEKPTIIFTLLGYQLPQHFLMWAKSQQINSICWLTEDPYMIDLSLQIAPYVSGLVTIEKNAWSFYTKEGYRTLHLPLGADYSIFKSTHDQADKKSDVCLIGYPYPERVKLISFLANELPIHITVAGNWYPHQLPANVKIASLWVSSEEAVQYYASTKVVLNSYRSQNQAENKNSLSLPGISPNNRVFEVAGCKVCQISEAREDWHQWFNKDDIPLFSTKEQALDQIEELLKNKQQRTLYATNSYNTAISSHSYTHRINELLTWLKQENLT